MASIVISEFMDAPAVARLQRAHAVDYRPTLVDDPQALAAAAAGADVLIVRNRTQVRGPLLDALQRCKVVGRLGVGLDNIDVAGCQARGIQVIPATGANANSVAEYVIACAFMLLRGAYHATEATRAGQWPRTVLSQGREIHGKTLGLVGFGSIGRGTLRNLAGAFQFSGDDVEKSISVLSGGETPQLVFQRSFDLRRFGDGFLRDRRSDGQQHPRHRHRCLGRQAHVSRPSWRTTIEDPLHSAYHHCHPCTLHHSCTLSRHLDVATAGQCAVCHPSLHHGLEASGG